MPLNGRNYLDLANFANGVHGAATRGDLSVNGQLGRNIDYVVDGVSKQGDRVGRRLEDRPVARRRSGIPGDHQPVLRGVRTLARRDRVGGHQERHERVPRHRLHLRSARRARREDGLTGTRTPFNQQQFGTVLSGPVVKDRTHFIGAFEGTNQDSQLVVTSVLQPERSRHAEPLSGLREGNPSLANNHNAQLRSPSSIESTRFVVPAAPAATRASAPSGAAGRRRAMLSIVSTVKRSCAL